MKIILTGASSCLAKTLLPQLCARPDVSEVLGIDIQPCTFKHPKFSFHLKSILCPSLAADMAGTSAVVHLAFAILRGARSQAQTHENNVAGGLKVFADAQKMGVSKVINLSSVSVYGQGLGLTEAAPLQPAPLFAYAQHKAEIERVAAVRFPRIIHLRSHLIYGRHAQKLLMNLNNSRVCILSKPPRPLIQVVHEWDVCQAIGLCLERNVQGAFNLAAPDETSLTELVQHVPRLRIPVPLRWARLGAALTQRLVYREELEWLALFDTPLTVACQRAQKILGWQPKFSAWQAREEMS
jgi:UDP-glucose 4-epimerase